MKKISAVILSGGKSTRMGHDKAHLVYENHTFLERIISQLSEIEDLYLSVGKEDRYPEYTQLRHIQDQYQESGPMGGIHRALSACENDILFVTACDMPFVDSQFAFDLLEHLTDQTDAVVPVDRTGRKHVLAALYRKGVADVLEKHLKAGRNKLTDALDELKVEYVRVEDFLTERKMMNINYWEQYQQMLKRSTPVISFVGYSNSGKTTILKNLIPLLNKEGLKTAYIKHTHHEVERVQKDSEKIFEAGVEMSCVISPTTTQIVKKGTIDIHKILKQIDFVDLILIEGYKHENFRKIMVLNEEESMPVPVEECLAVVSNNRVLSAEHWFSKEDYQGICQFIVNLMRKDFT